MQRPTALWVERRERPALAYALAREEHGRAVEPLLADHLAHLAAWRRTGGAGRFWGVPERARAKLLTARRHATRTALVRLAELGSVEWRYADEQSPLSSRLTQAGLAVLRPSQSRGAWVGRARSEDECTDSVHV